MNLKNTGAQLDPNGYCCLLIENPPQIDASWLENFDQNGYDITSVEKLFLERNGFSWGDFRWRNSMKTAWYMDTEHSQTGVHLNHADLYERKGFVGEARNQLHQWAERLPLLYKVIHLRPKWGIDISIDYVSRDSVFEVFHFEWDDFDFHTVQSVKQELEGFIETTDWEWAAHKLWELKSEWYHLDFFAQSRYKSNFFGVRPEQFKMVGWY